jgi:hypothetical protein
MLQGTQLHHETFMDREMLHKDLEKWYSDTQCHVTDSDNCPGDMVLMKHDQQNKLMTQFRR